MWRRDAVSEFICDALMWQRDVVSEFIWACTWLCSPRDVVPVNTHSLTLAHHRVSSSSVVEHLTRSRTVEGSNPIWDSDFSRVYVSPRIYIISFCCYFAVSILNLYLLNKLRSFGNKSRNSLATETTLNFNGPCRRVRPAKVTNHSARTNLEIQ